MDKFVGITGRAGSGKDTLADYLVAKHGFTKYTLSTPLKQAINAMFGWNMAMWEDRKWKETKHRLTGVSPRQLAQTLGTEWGRRLVGEDLWIRLLEDRINRDLINKTGLKIVVPDIRFSNEAQWLKSKGGTIVQIHRIGVAHASAHVSELGISHRLVDINIHNNGSLEEFLATSSRLLGVGETRAA
tara:strand:- start:10894 stop:11451 length:558 start_codon:yes stop_codon:yes gene_type:complete